MRRHHLLSIAALLAASPGLASAEVLQGLVRPIEQPGVAEQLPTGTVTLTVEDGELVIELMAKRLTPGVHLAHLHGFAIAEPLDAVCATTEADTNGDGFVDLIETRELSGVTLVPLTDDAVSLEIESESYPEANLLGEIDYRQVVDFEALSAAVEEKFGTPPALATRVVYLHGVPEDMPLPDSVRSLEGVPAHVTLPIACAELEPA